MQARKVRQAALGRRSQWRTASRLHLTRGTSDEQSRQSGTGGRPGQECSEPLELQRRLLRLQRLVSGCTAEGTLSWIPLVWRDSGC